MVDSKERREQFGKREVGGQRANVELKSIGTVIEKPKPGLLDLPEDIVIDIFYLLDNKDILSVTGTCQKLYHLRHSDEGDLSNARKELESLGSVEDHRALTSNQGSLFK